VSLAGHGSAPDRDFGGHEMRDIVGSNTGRKVRYAFRRPRFPVVYAVGNALRVATSSAALRRQLERLELPGAAVVDLVDATGEGWAFHSDLMIVSPLTLKKRWKKIEVIRLFNESANARRIGAVYPEAYVPRRSLERIIAEIAALAAYTNPRRFGGCEVATIEATRAKRGGGLSGVSEVTPQTP
jgi:hypothetical protein